MIDIKALELAALGVSSAFSAGAAYAGVRFGMRDHERRITNTERAVNRAHDRIDRLQQQHR